MQRARSGAASVSRRGADGRPPPLRQHTRRGGGGRLRPASPYRGAAAEHRGELLRRRAAAERQMLDAASECERLDRMLSDDDVSSHGRRERDSDFLGRGRPGGSMAVAIEQQQQQQALAYDEDNSAVQRRRSSQYSAAAGSGLSSSSSSGGGTGSSSTESPRTPKVYWQERLRSPNTPRRYGSAAVVPDQVARAADETPSPGDERVRQQGGDGRRKNLLPVAELKHSVGGGRGRRTAAEQSARHRPLLDS